MLTGVGLQLVAPSLLTGFFVAQQFAYVAVDQDRLRRLADQGDRSAARAVRVTTRLPLMLSGARLGITVTALLAGYVAGPHLGGGLARLFGTLGVPGVVSAAVALVLAMLVATVVQTVVGELAPKRWAIARPEALARALAGPTLAYLVVAGPVIRGVDAAANRLLAATGLAPVRLPTEASADDLRRIVAESRTGGLLDDQTAALLQRGLAWPPR
jgi:CBS domain containing-hemolysin-like protein